MAPKLFLESMNAGLDTALQERIAEGDWKYLRYYEMQHSHLNSDDDLRIGKLVS